MADLPVQLTAKKQQFPNDPRTNWKYIAIVAVLGLVAISGILLLLLLLKIDKCFDNGGRWDYEKSQCQEFTRQPCDLDIDGDCDGNDYEVFSKSVHMCSRDNPVSLPNVGIILEYNPMADANHDGCVALDDKELLFPNRNQEEMTTANWQTYRSNTRGSIIEELEFEVKYPEGFKLENNERDYDLTISRGSEYSPPWNFVTIFDPKSLRKSEIPSQSYLTWRDQFSVAFVKTEQTAKEFAEYVYKYNQDYPLNVRDFKETNIGNYKAYTFQCDSHCSEIPWAGSLSFGSPHEIVYLQNGKFVFILVVTEKPIFNQILSTFRFVD